MYCARDFPRYPPGHGDLYRSLARSGMLDELIAAGKEYLFVSNIDNLGSVVDFSKSFPLPITVLTVAACHPHFLRLFCLGTVAARHPLFD